MNLSSAPPRHTRSFAERGQGAVLALLVQTIFLLLMLLTPPHPIRPEAEKETLLLLPPLTRPPTTIDARARRSLSTARPIVPPPPSSAPVMTAPLAPPGGIAGFGRSLFDCAPENYANLTPDERAHCPKPGEGMAVNQPPDLMRTRSHVKDEAHWRQEWERVHSTTLLPCGDFGANISCLIGKIADGSLGEYGDPGKWPTYAVKQLSDRDFRKIEETYQAWRKDHPLPPAPN
jgi:hypothetical protein